MTEIELKSISSAFKDISPLIQEREELLKLLNRNRRKLRTKHNKYNFLRQVVDENSCGNELVNAIVLLLKDLGIGKVENVDKKYLDEDIRLWVDNLLLIFEVTGIPTENPKDDKVHQISKHIPIRKTQNPNKNVFGVFVVNHDNKKHYLKRTKHVFSQRLVNIAESHQYVLITTVDLLKAYCLIKDNEMTTDEFIKKLCTPGVFKI